MYTFKKTSYLFIFLLSIFLLHLSCVSGYNTFKVIQTGDSQQVTLLYSVDSSQIDEKIIDTIIKLYPSAREDNYNELREYLKLTQTVIIYNQDFNIGTELRKKLGISILARIGRGTRETNVKPLIDNGPYSTFKIINDNNIEDSQNLIILYGSDSSDFVNQNYPMIKIFMNDSKDYSELTNYLINKSVTTLIVSPQDTYIGTELRKKLGLSVIVMNSRLNRSEIKTINTTKDTESTKESNLVIIKNNTPEVENTFDSKLNPTENISNKESNLVIIKNKTSNDISKPINGGYIYKISSWFKKYFFKK